MKKYYLEFCFDGSAENYDLQSKWFDTEIEAINFYRNNFDYINEQDFRVNLMCGDFDKNDLDGDIEYVKDITSKINLLPTYQPAQYDYEDLKISATITCWLSDNKLPYMDFEDLAELTKLIHRTWLTDKTKTKIENAYIQEYVVRYMEENYKK